MDDEGARLLDPLTAGGPEEVIEALRRHGYLADTGLATAIYLTARLRRPLLLEGEPGVGKTEVARAIAGAMGSQLIRLQCYEGIDLAQALYEWDHARQILHLRTAEATGELAQRDSEGVESELYQERYLIRRPLLGALMATSPPPPVLLIDEVDRADDEFEAFLLEALSEYSVSIPELGTVRATVIPVVILTSNRTRDVHDALKRRCLYHWVEHPDLEREVAIVTARAPLVPESLARRVAGLVASFRDLGLYKPPGVAETIDWATALSMLGGQVTVDAAQATLGTVLKYREDQDRVISRGLGDLLAEAEERAGR